MESSSVSLLNQGIAAFAGAFFAFLFVRLAEFFSKLYERQTKHYNSLVTLGTQLNENITIINDNLFLLPNFRRVISAGHIYFNSLHVFPIDKSHYENLHDLDLINEVFSYFYQLRRINDDMTTMVSGYVDIKNALVQKNIKPSEYKINANSIADNLKMLEVFLKDMDEKTINLLARVRIQMKKEIPLGTRIQQLLIRTSEGKLERREIEDEVKKLKDEIESVREQSKREQENALKKYNTD